MAAPPEIVPLKTDPKYDDYDFPTVSATNQPGHAGHLTPQQEAQVYQLRMSLEQKGFTERLDTLTLLRFLRARKFDVALAELMFVNSEAWRKEINLDHLVQNFEYTEKAQIFEYYPQYYHKTDRCDLTAMNKITTQERMLQNLAVEYEKVSDPRLPACSRKSSHLLETCCTIMDLKGVGLAKISSVYGYVKEASAMSQNHYPERLGRLYLINAPWGFSSVFGMIKSFLDPVTVEKIHVLGSGYQSQLLAQVPAENLPEQFGGSCDCEGGCGFSDAGPWSEPEFYRSPKWAKKRGEEKKEDAVIDNTEGKGETVTATTTAPIPEPGGVAADLRAKQYTDHGITPA
ncbi:hypothetical protein GMDG_01334 [Pseudogymnoascus destructans 20631-21]|uniref:CRAL-TRIO domain-containing protein n=1 Tax=Pseudogymnoascus destructans (strain ATCC MYA-4855 / 20631-21) TaxID=658429 RepID=L8FS53_PSED2|nr:hypothetical protein GMDG_01334 [Pseudogymnoascus destructans 20631-21]